MTLQNVFSFLKMYFDKDRSLLNKYFHLTSHLCRVEKKGKAFFARYLTADPVATAREKVLMLLRKNYLWEI